MSTIDTNPHEGSEIIDTLPPMHPGEVLREEFIQPLGLSAGKVAKACHLPRTRIERIVREELGVTGDTAVRLARLFGTTSRFWLNLQAQYEARIAEAALAEVTKTIEPIQRAA